MLDVDETAASSDGIMNLRFVATMAELVKYSGSGSVDGSVETCGDLRHPIYTLFGDLRGNLSKVNILTAPCF